jgi:hypothetical protein
MTAKTTKTRFGALLVALSSFACGAIAHEPDESAPDDPLATSAPRTVASDARNAPPVVSAPLTHTDASGEETTPEREPETPPDSVDPTQSDDAESVDPPATDPEPEPRIESCGYEEQCDDCEARADNDPTLVCELLPQCVSRSDCDACAAASMEAGTYPELRCVYYWCDTDADCAEGLECLEVTAGGRLHCREPLRGYRSRCETDADCDRGWYCTYDATTGLDVCL